MCECVRCDCYLPRQLLFQSHTTTCSMQNATPYVPRHTIRMKIKTTPSRPRLSNQILQHCIIHQCNKQHQSQPHQRNHTPPRQELYHKCHSQQVWHNRIKEGCNCQDGCGGCSRGGIKCIHGSCIGYTNVWKEGSSAGGLYAVDAGGAGCVIVYSIALCHDTLVLGVVCNNVAYVDATHFSLLVMKE